MTMMLYYRALTTVSNTHARDGSAELRSRHVEFQL